MKQSNKFLTLAGVSKRYGAFAALDEFELQVGRGEFVSLLGPSGCGKTTTLRMIAGFTRPDTGEITLGGRVLSSDKEFVSPEMRNLGMVFQSYAVWPHMSVQQNIELPLRIRGLDRACRAQRCAEAIRLCHLEGFERRQPHELSGGQLQRVALARALAYQPPLVLLDEPLSNLDVALREQLRLEIHRLHLASGASFILVTHDQIEAMSLSDRVVVMNRGRIEQVGTPDEIYRNPQTEFVAGFVGGANLLNGTLVAIEPEARGSRWTVKVGSRLSLDVRGRGTAKPGDHVTLALHPEAIRLNGLADPAAPSITGIVREVQPLGRICEFMVDADGIGLRVARLRGDCSAQPGDQVQVLIDMASIVAVDVRAAGPLPTRALMANAVEQEGTP